MSTVIREMSLSISSCLVCTVFTLHIKEERLALSTYILCCLYEHKRKVYTITTLLMVDKSSYRFTKEDYVMHFCEDILFPVGAYI